MRRVAALLVLASLVAPGVSVVARAIHIATDNSDVDHDGPDGATSHLGLLRHGHAHEAGTAEHEHPLLVAGTPGVRIAAPEFGVTAAGLARHLEVAAAQERELSRLAPSHSAGVGPPRPPGSVSILRI